MVKRTVRRRLLLGMLRLLHVVLMLAVRLPEEAGAAQHDTASLAWQLARNSTFVS
jgi:hypothetical protein